MFDWISKPFIEWNFIDNFIACVSIGTIGIILLIIYFYICKIKEKLGRKRK